VSQEGEREQERLHSPDLQLDKINKTCADHGWKLIAEPEYERNISAGTPIDKRPVLRHALEAVESGSVQRIVAGDLSRIFRNLSEQLIFLARIKAAGAKVYVYDHGFVSIETASDTFQTQVLGAANEYQLNIAKEKSREGQLRAIQQGKVIIRGMHLGYHRVNQRLVIDSDTAPIVKQLFTKRAQRMPWTKLANWLNDVYPREGGQRWTHQTIKHIIGSPNYKGWSVSGDVVNEDAHEPVVTLAEMESSQ